MEFFGKIIEITPVQIVAGKYEKKTIVIEAPDKQTLVSDIFGSRSLDEFDAYEVQEGDTVIVKFRLTGKNSNGRRFGGIYIDNLAKTDNENKGLFSTESVETDTAKNDFHDDLPF